jgi:hypothetical protein
MSNLILPQNYQNPVLQKNLDAFFKRYPHERERLGPILSKPVDARPLPQVEVPPAPSKPPIRILLLLGVVNPMFLAKVLNDPTVRKENFWLFIFENDENALAFYFQAFDLTQVINHPKTEWFLMKTIDTVKGELFRALKPEGVSCMMYSVQVLQVHAPVTEEIKEYYEALPDVYHETASHVMHNHGNLDDSLIGVEATFRNKDAILQCPGVKDLKDYYRGCTAVVVGAGPSLDQDLETLKKIKQKVVVIAADAALKPLLKAGIEPDFVTSIERLNTYQRPFFEGLDPISSELVAFPVVLPELLDLYPGTVRIAYRNYSFFTYFEMAYPKGILRCGGSTSHLGVRLAAYFGCKRLLLLGLDSSYEEKDGLFRSHCENTGYPEWNDYLPLQEFQKKRNHAPALKAPNNQGKPVHTNITYYQWVKEYAEELSYVGQYMAIINCSKTGLAIPGVPHIPLEDVEIKTEDRPSPKPQPKPELHTRSWDNKELLKNLEGWLQLSLEGQKEARALAALSDIPHDRFNALLYTLHLRMLAEDMFVSFVVQCCAKRFFELENKWWALSSDYYGDLPSKVRNIEERFMLFEESLTKLINIIKTYG